ncbi:MAG: hypothetical protein WB902_00825, partial [Acetobacteraceae bacterium]
SISFPLGLRTVFSQCFSLRCSAILLGAALPLCWCPLHRSQRDDAIPIREHAGQSQHDVEEQREQASTHGDAKYA